MAQGIADRSQIGAALESVTLEDLNGVGSHHHVKLTTAVVEIPQRPDQRDAHSELHWQPVMDVQRNARDQEGDGTGLKPSESEKRRDVLNAQLARLNKPISSIDLKIQTDVQAPESRAALVIGNQTERLVTATGISPSLPSRRVACYSHRPLYFEEIDVERCGNGWGPITNAMSLGIFFSNTVALPYRMATQRPDRCTASGPDCRACEMLGSDFEPLEKLGGDWRGLTATAASLAGFSFLFL